MSIIAVSNSFTTLFPFSSHPHSFVRARRTKRLYVTSGHKRARPRGSDYVEENVYVRNVAEDGEREDLSLQSVSVAGVVAGMSGEVSTSSGSPKGGKKEEAEGEDEKKVPLDDGDDEKDTIL